MARARADEQRVQRQLRAEKDSAEREAADHRRKQAEAARAATALIPEVRAAARALGSQRRLGLQKLTKSGFWSGNPRHKGWVVEVGRGGRFEVSFAGDVTVNGESLEEFVQTGLIAHDHTTTNSDRSESWVTWEPVADILDRFLTAAASALAQAGR